MDQGNPTFEDGAVAPSRSWQMPPRVSPLRAALLVMGAVLGGVALSLILGSSPAHAAGGDGSPADPGQNPLASVTSVVTTTVSSTVDQAIPAVQGTVNATEESIVSAVPVAEPLVAPVVKTVDTALAVVQQAAAPVVDSMVPFAQPIAAIPNGMTRPVASAPLAGGAQTGQAAGWLPAPQNRADSGSLPDPILTSNSGAPAAALGVLLALFALVLLTARRRLDDDTLPASPTYETDTSPA